MIDKIDHIVYAVPDLASGISNIETLLGVKAFSGGRHQDHGTHNALIRIGLSSYLEIIAPDPSNKNHTSDRWMGVDLINKIPRITRWAIKSKVDSPHLAILHHYNPELSMAADGARIKPDGKLLSWKLSLPLSQPMVECCPFIIEWPYGIHPVNSLPMDCQLADIKVITSDTQRLSKVSAAFGLDLKIESGIEDQIIVTLQCPNGRVVLS